MGKEMLKMECEICKSEELEEEIIKTVFTFFMYFDEYIKEDTVKFKCKKCGYEWTETI